ncbi:MAG TPA: cytochrome c biogenesis protein CcsA [Candidatus Kapabacteria bacterium]|nr:cytochrome c biogenesis protein CcsA [Candidatus Kapabacteria bacterium]
MGWLSSVILPVLTILYGLLLAGGALFFFKKAISHQVLYYLTLVTGFAHTLYIGSYTVSTGHCLLTTASEIFSLIAFTLLITYIIVELRPTSSSSGTGMVVALVAFLFQLISAIGVGNKSVAGINPIFLEPSFNIHVTSAVFGYAALTLSTIYGSLYLLLYRAMKKNSFGPIFNELPSLSWLERYGLRALFAGFIFLSISILFGFLLIQKNFSSIEASQYLSDPKTIATGLIWLIFGTTLLLRKLIHIDGRKLVLFWMSGYLLTLISMTIVNAFVTEYHRFL